MGRVALFGIPLQHTWSYERGNYERLFDAARTRVRAWERANVPGAAAQR